MPHIRLNITLRVTFTVFKFEVRSNTALVYSRLHGFIRDIGNGEAIWMRSGCSLLVDAFHCGFSCLQMLSKILFTLVMVSVSKCDCEIRLFESNYFAAIFKQTLQPYACASCERAETLRKRSVLPLLIPTRGK